MPLLKRNKLSMLSVTISLLSILTTTLINIEIAKEYLQVDGKTRALFGIKELYEFGYQYYVALLGIISLTLSLFGLKDYSKQNKKYIAIL